MASPLNPHVEKVMRLLLDEGLSAAEHYVDKTLTPEVDAARIQYERAQRDEMSARNVITLARGSASGLADTDQPAEDSPELWNDKRAAILMAADAVHEMGRPVTTAAVLELMAARNQVLSGARPGTSVGNTLHKDSNWVRLSEGVFKRKN